MLNAPLPLMFTIKTILVAVDFGDSSDAAFRYALTFARAFDATILVMHAVDVPTDAYPGYPLLPMGDISGVMEAAARKGLEAELARAREEWPKVKSVLRRGKPWREVIAVAAEEHADLIVMGTHGRQGISHALLGSVAERVVRASPMPVLTIRAATIDASPIASDEPKTLDEVDRYEQRLSRPSAATIEASTLSGAIAGMTAGALAGPVGALAGGWLGTAVGAFAGVALDEEQERARAKTAKLDAEVGVIGGDMGAAAPDLPPAKVGAFSAGSAGVAPPAASGPSEGPMQDLSEDG